MSSGSVILGGGGSVATVKVTVGRANYVCNSSQNLVALSDTSSAWQVTLPSCASYPANQELTIQDESGAAAFNPPLILSSASSELVGLYQAISLLSNYGSVTLVNRGSSWGIKSSYGSIGSAKYPVTPADISSGRIILLDARIGASYTLSSGHLTNWSDWSGNGNNFVTGLSTGTAVYDSTFFGNLGGFNFQQAGSAGLQSSAAISPALSPDNMTVVMVMQRNLSEQGPIVGDNATGNIYLHYPTESALGYRTAFCLQKCPLATDMVQVTTHQNGVTKFYLGSKGPFPIVRFNGVQPVTPAPNFGKMGICNVYNFGGTGDVKIGYFAVYNRVLSPTEINQLVQYLSSSGQWNIADPVQPYNIIFDGNSITDAQGENSYVNEVPRSIGVGQQNFMIPCQGGKTITQLIARFPTFVAPYYDPTKLPKYNIYTVLEITNELNQVGATAANVEQLYKQLCLMARAAGFKVIPATCLPRGTASANYRTGFEADRLTVNTWLRSNYTSFADGLVDLGGDSTMGVQSACTNTGLYIDGIHPTNSAHQTYLAPLWTTAINSVLNS